MNAQTIRRWIGAYVLVLTAVLGAYLTLAGGSWLLPLEDKDVTSSFQIVIPFLLGQVVLTYKFFAGGGKSSALGALPGFFVKAPLLAVTAILVVTFVLMGIGGYQAATWTPSGTQFKNVLTFTVALLNGSTVFIAARYFELMGAGEVGASGRERVEAPAGGLGFESVKASLEAARASASSPPRERSRQQPPRRRHL